MLRGATKGAGASGMNTTEISSAGALQMTHATDYDECRVTRGTGSNPVLDPPPRIVCSCPLWGHCRLRLRAGQTLRGFIREYISNRESCALARIGVMACRHLDGCVP